MKLITRSRRTFWSDLRFLIGIALVVVSIVGVWLVISSSGTTTPVLQASHTIVPGEPLTSDDFQVVDVNLGASADGYLAPQDLREGVVAARTLAEGELVPESATQPADASRSTTIIVESQTGVPADVSPGAVVELWHAAPLEDGQDHETPRILVPDATVASVTRTEAVLASDATSVELVIDRADVAEVLAAITGGSALSIVPTSGPRS